MISSSLLPWETEICDAIAKRVEIEFTIGDIIFDKPNVSLTRRLRVVAVLQPFDP
jgi:hypothetical protein